MNDISLPADYYFVPHDYQLEGAKKLYVARKCILADEMRVRKTGQALMAWKKTNRIGPALIIAKPNAQATWVEQSPRWHCQTPYIISGTAAQRAKEWKEVDKTSLVMTTIEALRQDIFVHNTAPRKWGLVIYDEAHRATDRKRRNYKTLKELTTEYLFLLTGSPMRRGFQDLWALLNLCDHRRWSSYWRFTQTFGYMQQNEWGAWEVLGLKEERLLYQSISTNYLRRERKDVRKDMPPKQRILDHKIYMTKHQQKLYDQMRDEMIIELTNNELVVAPTVLAKITRLRQLLCCPLILDEECADWGAGLEHLGEILEETDDHHFVIFTPFTAAIPHVQRYLLYVQKEPQENIFTLQGGMKGEEVSSICKAFRDSRGIMICSVSYAESFDLFPASWAYFLGFSWSPIENLQAEDRLQSMDAKDSVAYYYPTHHGGVDTELQLEALNLKASEMLKVYRQSNLALQRILRLSQ